MSQSVSDLILISERKEDVDFFSSVATATGKKFFDAQSAKGMTQLLSSNSNAIVLWDADHANAAVEAHPMSALAIRLGLLAHAKNFALTSKPINTYENLFAPLPDKRFRYQNNILRRYDEAATQLLPRVFAATHEEAGFGLAPFFEPSVRIQKIILKRSAERPAAANAVESFLEKSGVSSKIAAKIAQASDELLMNAIFSAPRDKVGNAPRQNLIRTAKFNFNDTESVELETALADDYAAICVTDGFGSLLEENIVKFLGQNFQSKDYAIRKFGTGAGLGLYGVVQSGLSLFYRVLPNKRTDAYLFFKRTGSAKNIKTGFQFSACTFLKSFQAGNPLLS